MIMVMTEDSEEEPIWMIKKSSQYILGNGVHYFLWSCIDTDTTKHDCRPVTLLLICVQMYICMCENGSAVCMSVFRK